MTHDPSVKCESCGADLSSPDAICTRCEKNLSMPNDDRLRGKFCCPGCACRFDAAAVDWWSPNQKWYLPQTQQAKCPRCGTFLIDRLAVRPSDKENNFFSLLIFLSIVFSWHPAIKIAIVASMASIMFYRWRRAKAQVFKGEDRYVVLDPA